MFWKLSLALATVFCLIPATWSAGAPKISAKSAIVVDADTGRVLFEKNADTRRPVASTQKLLTSLLVIEAGKLDKSVTVQLSDTKVEPTKLGIKKGDIYTRRKLIQAMLVKSCNDVARCLARQHSGSEKAFAEVMTGRARNLGMAHSRFKNASGLPAKDQYSTARDMAKLGRAAYANPTIRDVIRVPKLTFHFSDGREGTLNNTNKLLRRFPGCDGMKTGYTRASGRCLVASGTRYGRAVVVVVLGCNPSAIWRETSALLEHGLERTSAGTSS